MKPAVLHTERLVLEPLGMKHLATAVPYSTDRENGKYMFFYPMADEAEVAEYLAGAEAEWAKERPEERLDFAVLKDGRHIGCISFFFEDDPCELGWILARDCHRQGIGCEAASALIEYGRRELGCRRFTAHCDSENTASWKLMEKLGMHRTSAEHGRRNRSMGDEDRIEYRYEVDY